VARPKQIDDGIRVSTVMPRKQLEWLQQMARKMSVRENKNISTSELIRMTMESTFPPPKNTQGDMFS
jgi:hypothetical protein